MITKRQETKIANFAKELGISYQTLYNAMANEGQRKPEKYQVIPKRRWTQQEEALIANIRQRGEIQEIAKVLNRSITSCKGKRALLGQLGLNRFRLR